MTTKAQDALLADKSVVFVGGGNMAGALLDGLLQAQSGAKLGVIDKHADKLALFAKQGVATALPEEAEALLAKADVVVLAVKPQVLAEVCASIFQHLTDKLIISVAAGISLAQIQTMTGTDNIVRVMPNLPATVGYGASGMFADSAVSDENKTLADSIMCASGMTVWVADEAQLHTVTAVAGSAPAYFFYMLEAMIDKATAMGLDGEAAKALAAQTMQGAALMAKEHDPASLRAKVTSKGGTTHAAITSLEHADFATMIAEAMTACATRSRELGA